MPDRTVAPSTGRTAVVWAAFEAGGRTWPIRMQRCCGGVWTVAAFEHGRVLAVGLGASRAEALDVLCGRLPAAAAA